MEGRIVEPKHKYAVIESVHPLMERDNIEVSTGDGGMQYWRIYGLKVVSNKDGYSIYRAKLRKYVMKPMMFVGHKGMGITFREFADSQAAAQWMRTGSV